MRAWVGDPMGRAWQYVLAYPGCSKRSAAVAATSQQRLSEGYRVIDRAIELGLVAVERREGATYVLVAVPFADLSLLAARALMAWFTRCGAQAPAGLVDRLAPPAGKTA